MKKNPTPTELNTFWYYTTVLGTWRVQSWAWIKIACFAYGFELLGSLWSTLWSGHMRISQCPFIPHQIIKKNGSRKHAKTEQSQKASSGDEAFRIFPMWDSPITAFHVGGIISWSQMSPAPLTWPLVENIKWIYYLLIYPLSYLKF